MVDLCLLLSQATYNCSLTPVYDDVDLNKYDVAAQCGANPNPKLDLMRTHTRLT